MAGEAPRLTGCDMVPIVRKPWEDAFHPDVSRKGWKQIGFDPATKGCNRELYWKLKEEDAKAAAKNRIRASHIVLDTRLGGEDFRLGLLSYGPGRAKLEERQKRKAEEEAKKSERRWSVATLGDPA